MTEKRFIRNIMGNIYDSKNDKWFEEDWKGKPLDYDDDLIVFLNEQQAEIEQLKDDVYDELDKALKVLEEIYEDYPKNNVHRLYNNLKGLKEMVE